MKTNHEFAATIGLDWADRKHDLWVRPADGSAAQHLQLAQKPEALHEWVGSPLYRMLEQAEADQK